MTEERNETEFKMEDVVYKTAMCLAYCRMFDTLSVLSQFMVMVFEEKKTKKGQLELIKSSFEEQIEDKKTLLREYPEAIGDIGAITLVQDFVDKAFTFTTYSSLKRRDFIISSITKELRDMEDSVKNTQKILDTLLEEEHD